MRSKVDPDDFREFLSDTSTGMEFLKTYYMEYLHKTHRIFIESLLDLWLNNIVLSTDQYSWAAYFVYQIAAKMGVNPITGARISRQSH